MYPIMKSGSFHSTFALISGCNRKCYSYQMSVINLIRKKDNPTRFYSFICHGGGRMRVIADSLYIFCNFQRKLG